jgi:acyl-CoA thioester hydrolase
MARAHIDLELRWGDQDAYGHVNNVAYSRYLEEARVRLFWLGTAREKTGMEGHFRADSPDGPKMLVASQTIQFINVLNYSEHPIVIEAWIGKLGGSSLEVHYEIFDHEQLVIARAKTVVVVVNGRTLRPERLSAAGREAVAPWMEEPLELR